MSLITTILTKIFGSKYERDIKEITPIFEKIKVAYETIKNLSSDELRAKTQELKKRVQEYIKTDLEEIENLKKQAEIDTDISNVEKIYENIDELEKKVNNKTEEILNEILPEAFAIVKETARRFKENTGLTVTATDYDRELAAKHDFVEIQGDKAIYKNSWMAGGSPIVWDMAHYDVQLIGGIILHQGKIAEMATGEGKTLVATLPVFLNALAGQGVHIVTVNDYLAKRDSEWMGPIYQFHGLTVDCIDKHEPNSIARRKAYYADITYGTNNEFGFDYLRDNMAINPEELVQRKHHYAIVDEVDSVLIDDARTPLIISGPVSKDDDQLFNEYKPRVEKVVNAQKKLINEILVKAKKHIADGDKEKGGFYLLQAFKGLPKNNALIKFLSEEGNKVLLQKTENFYMQENNKNMHLVTDELYFVIDEKLNSVDLTEKGIDLISEDIGDDKFFVLPDVGSAIAEIEKSDLPHQKKLEKKEEIIREYSIKSERVHTVTQLLKAYTMFEKDVEYVVIDNKVKIVDEQTGRILEGRRYSDGLHQAIEAKERVKVEAATQTMATITLQNYFRMYHKLAGMTGTAETEAAELWNIYKLDVVVIPTNKPVIRIDYDDLVYKTKREKYNAVINEILKLNKEGRPVLVGTTSVEVSELLSRMLTMRNIKHNVLNAKQHQREAEIIAHAGKPRSVTIATNMAGRGTDIKITDFVKEIGGLAIIGTERHESRRVDRQLRGRAGRQGDPGTSQFYVSLEDDLMRLFGSDKIASIMDRLGLKEGEVIQAPLISKSIERAQKKVEENNFGIRKRLLEYDDVMNSQREVIYKRRRHALFGERLNVDIANVMYEVVDQLVEDFHKEGDFEGFSFELLKNFGISTPFTNEEFIDSDKKVLSKKLFDFIYEEQKRRASVIASQVFPIIKDVYEKQAQIYENIVIPVTDGTKVYQVICNLEKAYISQGLELIEAYKKNIVLSVIDNSWREHLRDMDDLKQAVHTAYYEQKDPLIVYKFESFELFRQMIEKINNEIVSILMKGHIPIRDTSGVKKAQGPQRLDMSRFTISKTEVPQYSGQNQSQQQSEQRKPQPIKVEKKVGRNDPCPCGSGKKYKNCHGRTNENELPLRP
jgi:preprotein translocase subunit SecA